MLNRLVLLLTVAVIAAAPASAQPSKCAAGERLEAGKRVAGLARCRMKAIGKGDPIDPACIAKVESKFQSRWAKAQSKGDCPAAADATAVGTGADAFVGNLALMLDPRDSGGPSRCAAAKFKAAGKAFFKQSKCHATAARRGQDVDPACLAKAEAKRGEKWQAAEQHGDCYAAGDETAVLGMIDAMHVQLAVHLAGGRVLRGVGVIADFADAALEDYQGGLPGTITKVAQFREVLNAMESHWLWLSVGTELVAWDLVRVTLDQSLTADAFPGWSEYRAAVASRAVGQVELGDYDADDDGTLDAMFVLASNHGQALGYVIGGASSNGGASLFVDGQDSDSIRGRHIGNFNHELGHLFGLPDEYGAYDNLNFLTLMAWSWPLPPGSFSAWDRYKLGWLEPTVIAESTDGVVLHPAESNLQAVIVPTGRPSEYFVIEYRRKPASGYGTGVATNYNGLAIYHVWETAGSNSVDPGLIRLEPPDGNYGFGTVPTDEDFWFPGNPVAPAVFAGRPYYDEASVVLEVDNLAWTGDGGIRFDVAVYDVPVPSYPPDPILNGDFESGMSNAPANWTTAAWMAADTDFTWEQTAGVGGSRCGHIENTAPNDAWYEQTVTGLTVGQTYRLSAMLKVESIDVTGASVGANIAIIGGFVHSTPINQVSDWTLVELEFVADATSAPIGCRLGFFGSTVTGSLLCDDITIEWVP